MNPLKALLVIYLTQFVQLTVSQCPGGDETDSVCASYNGCEKTSQKCFLLPGRGQMCCAASYCPETGLLSKPYGDNVTIEWSDSLNTTLWQKKTHPSASYSFACPLPISLNLFVFNGSKLAVGYEDGKTKECVANGDCGSGEFCGELSNPSGCVKPPCVDQSGPNGSSIFRCFNIPYVPMATIDVDANLTGLPFCKRDGDCEEGSKCLYLINKKFFKTPTTVTHFLCVKQIEQVAEWWAIALAVVGSIVLCAIGGCIVFWLLHLNDKHQKEKAEEEIRLIQERQQQRIRAMDEQRRREEEEEREFREMWRRQRAWEADESVPAYLRMTGWAPGVEEYMRRRAIIVQQDEDEPLSSDGSSLWSDIDAEERRNQEQQQQQQH